MPKILGIDISNWQGAVNWDAIKGSGVVFAIVKASESTNYKDVQLDRNKAEMRRVDMPHGFYHFARGGDARAEAEAFAASVGEVLAGEVLALDWEIAYRGDADAWAAAFIQRVKELTNTTCMFYASESVITGQSWEKVRATGAGLWCAKYGTNNGQAQSEPSKGNWEVLAIWQYTSVAAISGIGGHVDADLFYGAAETFLKYGAPGKTTVPKPVQPAAPVPGVNSSETYTVQSGDNLSKIAAQFGTTVPALAAINGISNPNLIFPGQVLRVTTAVPATMGAGTTYVVVKGDTLSGIASKFNTTYQALASANGIVDVNHIYPGQRIVIPGASAAPVQRAGQTYTIKSGDTLSGIASRFGTNFQHLAAINGIADPNKIAAGQTINIS